MLMLMVLLVCSSPYYLALAVGLIYHELTTATTATATATTATTATP